MVHKSTHAPAINSWCNGDTVKIYASHLLSSWGDRMWAFAVGLYLIILYPKSLQLTAVYGLSVCVSVIVFGATLGKWIDKTKRITVAQIALIVQNCAVVSCSIVLISLLYYKSFLEDWYDGAGKTVLIVSVIVLAVIANLGSEASKIALEKDWIVVLSGGDEVKLAKMNATMRSIDLATFILAPILVGQIITYGSQIAGASFIASWNIVSGFCEYFLLTNIYKRIPQLSKKNIPLIRIDSPDDSPKNDGRVIPRMVHEGCEGSEFSKDKDTYLATEQVDMDLTFDELTEVSLASPVSSRSWNPFLHKVHPENLGRRLDNCCVMLWYGFKNRFIESINGWRDYFAHPVRGAGIGLALLYMTVLGFDSITTGYAYSQGVSESLLGIMTATGALFGILGSVSFPYLRKKLGKCTTGILGFGLETGCLILCLVSVIAPGSPFIHKNFLLMKSAESNTVSSMTFINSTKKENDIRTSLTPSELWNTRISVILLMLGIICARYGLWIADLSVIQIFQEEIPADKRGVLNGVQGSLNQGMNLLKFIIVILLPNPDTFAYLICLSWIFVFSGWVSFMIFSLNFHQHISVQNGANKAGVHVDTLKTGRPNKDEDNTNRANNN